MTTDYRKMWEDLGINMKKHDQLLAALPLVYQDVYLTQKNRPNAMEYYDFVISGIHGIRVKELLDAKDNGKKIVAYFCLYVPEELVIASNAVLVGLCGGSNFVDQEAEEVLPRNICPLIKASYGFKAARICPYFQAADICVGETTCDGKKKMYELLNELCPTYTVEVPQKPETEQAKELFYKELSILKSKLEELTGHKITIEDLKKSIKIVNAKRAALEKLTNTRKASPPPISGKDALLVSQIAFYDDPQRFTQKTMELVKELEERIKKGEGVVDAGAPRIMISGCPMAIPNWKLHHIVESSGAVIVVEESCVGTRYTSMGKIDSSANTVDELLRRIANAYLNIHCSCFTPNTGRVEDNVRLAKEFKVDGVIHYSLQTCHGYNIEAAKIERALKEINVPMLRIETDYSNEDTGQITTRVQAFLEMIKK
ncbi:MAG: double-cubane-cluster-containing anaerobic reductase [Candidatus Jordarchaeaceae archaeon]